MWQALHRHQAAALPCAKCFLPAAVDKASTGPKTEGCCFHKEAASSVFRAWGGLWFRCRTVCSITQHARLPLRTVAVMLQATGHVVSTPRSTAPRSSCSTLNLGHLEASQNCCMSPFLVLCGKLSSHVQCRPGRAKAHHLQPDG